MTMIVNDSLSFTGARAKTNDNMEDFGRTI